ncbi:hypothetical protein WJX84_011339 [Apatococcus fuscideae]|uniref:Aminoglycoside phosphotransferase domain-containing protein n=1 Tax=Apatococcus fuscideae TaxID=2026836 RepID=A0AAW1T4I7_9CHLO
MDVFAAEIDKVERKIDQAEGEVKEASAQGRVEKAHQLREEKQQLRKVKEQLREEKLVALRASGGREEHSQAAEGEPAAKRRRQEETVLNSLARDLPSASVVAGYPKEFSKFLERFPIHMHRPCHDCTIPLTAMRREFGQFQEDYHVANPIPEDCKFARQFCETVSKVHPDEVKADALPYKWQAVTMEYLAPPEWVPLSILAPVRLEAPLDSALPPPLSLQAWDAVADLARVALKHAQKVRLAAPARDTPDGLPTVHGDLRLPNIMAHLASIGEVDAIIFLDFDWAGAAGVSRCPVIMNPEIHWPIGADPQMLMDQTHDTQLLEAELRKGAVLADAYMPFGLLMQGLAEQNENTRLHGACEP